MNWSWGYFPSYTFGRLMALQLYLTFLKENRDFKNRLKSGDFNLLHPSRIALVISRSEVLKCGTAYLSLCALINITLLETNILNHLTR